jgi:hypothetical protein
MSAVGSGHVGVVKYTFDALDSDINAVNDFGSTLMHAAVSGTAATATQAEICEVIQFLADKGAKLDEKDGRAAAPRSILLTVCPSTKAWSC